MKSEKDLRETYLIFGVGGCDCFQSCCWSSGTGSAGFFGTADDHQSSPGVRSYLSFDHKRRVSCTVMA